MAANDPFGGMRFTVRRVSFWQVAVVVAVALAVGTALAVVAASVFLVLFPIVAIAGLAYKLFGGRKSSVRTASGATVIDAEYRVLSAEEVSRESTQWDDGRRIR
ncbi:hypothetical protein [Ancylobacter sp. G4_0304]|uniref:hypothetical protein n=1 Tax=Ancylobacter sp. G4_0304 TaxID=3114289 RepID=UPI0039C5DD07